MVGRQTDIHVVLTSAISSSPRSSFGLVKPCWAVKFVNLCPSSLVTKYVSGRSASGSSNFFTYWNLLLAMLNDQDAAQGQGTAAQKQNWRTPADLRKTRLVVSP